jgi:ABC-2 type transport system permease protein
MQRFCPRGAIPFHQLSWWLGLSAVNYYSVSLAEHVSATAFGSAAALCVFCVLLGVVIRFLTKNEKLAYAVSIVMILAVCGAYFVDSTVFEGLLPDIMTRLSLFERFYTIVSGVFDLTAIVYYLTVIIFFLFLSVQSLEKRRYN